MPPKGKSMATLVNRPNISDSSLLLVPEDAVEGFEERIETGIQWTNLGAATRHHISQCLRTDIPEKSFSEALAEKIQNSYIYGFLDKNSNLNLQEHYEFTVPVSLWENEKFANEEGKICFFNRNCLTDNIDSLLKRAVSLNDGNALKKDLKQSTVLRVNGTKMTKLDEELKKFKHVANLNLSCNYISNLDADMLPECLVMLELSTNAICNVEHFVEKLPKTLKYLGLARNLLISESVQTLHRLPASISVLDLGDNDICVLEEVLTPLRYLSGLISLTLAGNPCSVCAAYAQAVQKGLPQLIWLDNRTVEPSNFPEPFEPHPDEFRSAYFYVSVIRVISIPPPPKVEKGITQTFHVEFDLPLLDSKRRQFLMFRNNDSLEEIVMGPEEDDYHGMDAVSASSKLNTHASKKSGVLYPSEVVGEEMSEESDIYAKLERKNSREILHYTVFETPRVPWNTILTFSDPPARILCTDLTALRNTFRTVITFRLVYTQVSQVKAVKAKGKADAIPASSDEYRLVLATVTCPLQRADWSQPYQHFHWDDTFKTDEAMHWGDGDLTMLQYGQQKPGGKSTAADNTSVKLMIPENLTCHFGIGLEVL